MTALAFKREPADDPSEPSPFLDLHAWLDEEPPPRRWLVPGLIPDRCVTSLYGDGGSGKTMLALTLMVAMTTRGGMSWLGEPTHGLRSVGLFAEDDGDEIIRRLHRVCKAHGVAFGTVADKIHPLPGVGRDTIIAGYADSGELVITPLMSILLDRVKTSGAGLLVIDYAAAVFGGNELDRFQVSDFMRRLNALARDYDIAILLLGHPSMEGMKGGRGTSGSTAWRNQARSFLHLTVNEDQDDPAGRSLLTLKHTKSNYGRSGRAFKLAFDGSTFDILDETDNALRKAAGPRLTSAQTVCLNALKMALDHEGEVRQVTPGRIDKRCVSVEAWRAHAYSMGVSGSKDEDSRRRAFYDTRKALQAKGITGEAEPWAWLS